GGTPALRHPVTDACLPGAVAVSYFNLLAVCLAFLAVGVGVALARLAGASSEFVGLGVALVLALDLPLRWLINGAREHHDRTLFWPLSRRVGGHVGFVPVWVW